MITITLNNVSVGYGKHSVLNDLNFKVDPSRMVGLIGPNGSGKSTIIRVISGVLNPLAGCVLIDGRDITAISTRNLARLVGVVPQIPLLPSAFTAFEIVLMGRNPHLGLFQYEGTRELEHAWQAMQRTSTEHLAQRKIGELSGGEIQGILIARVLAQETKAVLLDEPTANLDIGRQIEILDMMKDLCKEKNLAVLVALHDLNLASQYCDRLILINRGSIHSEGKPQEVITQENIREVYGPEDCVFTHPANGLPVILVTTRHNRVEGNN